MLWIDVKYCNMLSPQLEKYSLKQSQPFLANFRCPICGDSKKNKNKTRGYVFVKGSGLFFKCHNCSTGLSIGNLIKRVNPSLHDQYKLEMFREKGHSSSKRVSETTVMEFEPPKFEKKFILDELLDRLDALPEDNEAVRYAAERMIPREKWSELYYVDDVKKIEQLSEKYKDKIMGREPRLVIPVRNRVGRLVGVTCRALGEHPVKYVLVKIAEDQPMIFGLDTVDSTKQVFVVEGPLDSMFLPNALAVMTSDLTRALGHSPVDSMTMVFDNQPRNPHVCRQMERGAKAGAAVCVWPSSVEEKDLNDMVLSGKSPEELLDLINTNTHRGLAAVLAIKNWRKC